MHEEHYKPDAGRALSCEAKQVLASCEDAVQEMYLWYSGYYMAETAPLGGSYHRAAQVIASTYGDKVEVPQHLYRLDRGDLTQDATTDKPILSWSRDEEAAEHFYKTFTMGVNRWGASEYDWRIIRASNNKPLVTFEATLAFLRDSCRDLYEWVNDEDMHGSKEVICETPRVLEGFKVCQSFKRIPLGPKERHYLEMGSLRRLLGWETETPAPAWGE